MRIGLAATIACFVIATATPAAALTKGAAYLVAERIRQVCPNGGRFDAGVIERDITGDGKADLILDLAGLKCRGAYNGTNDECGAAHCPVIFYVRKGQLLQFVDEVASIGAKVGRGNPPAIHLVNFDYSETTVRWTGRAFE